MGPDKHMLKILTKNRQNIYYFLDFSGNAPEFLIICTKTSKYLNIYYQKRPKYFFLFSITWRVNILSMSAYK
jgi:hypothetical protein